MADTSHLPHYQVPHYERGDIHTYISRLRKFVFFSQQDAADYFRLDRSRISRYESYSEPDDAQVGYIACLLKLVAERQTNSPDVQHALLADVNLAFREKTQHIPFADWPMLCAKADAYLEKQQRDYVEKWLFKNFSKKLTKAEQISFLESRVGPASYQDLVGMQVELDTLRKLLVRPGPPWIIAITGLGGVGKTSLAHALTLAVIREQLFDNVGWIDIRQPNSEFEKWRRSTHLNAFDATTIFDELLLQLAPEVYKSIGVSPLEPFDLLQARFTRIPHLIVIDNLETVEGIAELITKVQSLTNPTKFLLTSRSSLAEEPAVYSYPLHGLTLADAMALLQHEATLRNVPRIKQATQALLGQIYALVGGNPLVLRLVVGQAITRPLDTILAELSQVREEKTEALFAFIFADTWRNLSGSARLLLFAMLLSTTHGVNAAYLAAVTQFPSRLLHSLLDQLSALNLVNNNHAPLEEQVRYTIHSLTRTYLRHLVNASAPTDSALLRTSFVNSVQYMRQHIQEIEGILAPEVHDQALQIVRYGLEKVTLWPDVRVLLLNLAPKMEQAGLRDTWLSYLLRGVRFSKQVRDGVMEAELRFHLGTLRQRRGDYRQAYTEFRLAAARFAKEEQAARWAGALNRKAYVARLMGNFSQAKSLAECALASAQIVESERAYSLLVLGAVQLDLRDFVGAEALFQQALAIWRNTNEPQMMARCLTNLGAALRPLRRYEEAIAVYQQALEIFEEAKDFVHLAVVWMNLGNIDLVQDKLQSALLWYNKAQDLFVQFPEQLRLAQIYMNMGMAHYKLSEWEKAEAFFVQSMNVYQALGNTERMANAMDALGLTFLQQARYPEAIRIFEEALAKLATLAHPASYTQLWQELKTHLQEATQLYQAKDR